MKHKLLKESCLWSLFVLLMFPIFIWVPLWYAVGTLLLFMFTLGLVIND